jgi:hypothetical protein
MDDGMKLLAHLVSQHIERGGPTGIANALPQKAPGKLLTPG